MAGNSPHLIIVPLLLEMGSGGTTSVGRVMHGIAGERRARCTLLEDTPLPAVTRAGMIDATRLA
jgi:hypothetical protein